PNRRSRSPWTSPTMRTGRSAKLGELTKVALAQVGQPADGSGVRADRLQLSAMARPGPLASEDVLRVCAAKRDCPLEEAAALFAPEDPEGVPPTARASTTDVCIALPPPRPGVVADVRLDLRDEQRADQEEARRCPA